MAMPATRQQRNVAPITEEGAPKPVTMSLRLLPGLAEQLREAAKESGRSVTGEINQRLISSLEGDTGVPRALVDFLTAVGKGEISLEGEASRQLLLTILEPYRD